MAGINLTATLSASGNLSEKLDDVAKSATKLATSLEGAEESMRDMARSAGEISAALEGVEEGLGDVAKTSTAADKGLEGVDSAARDASMDAEIFDTIIESLSGSLAEVAAAGAVGSRGIDEVGDEARGATPPVTRLTQAVLGASGASAGSVPAFLAGGEAIDKMGDEAAEARNKMAGAASMAELLSLKSSALSINVGAFTIALRNLTTQVPLLVASLGNLVEAITGVGIALGGIGVGGFAVAIGGAVTQVEELAGEAATLEEKMQAIQAIGQEFMSMLREAIQPLTEMQGAADTFITLMEEIATTVEVFSQSIADSWEAGPLREAIGNLSDAWMESIVGIGNAMERMTAEVGVPLSEVLADGIRALDDFIVHVTNVVDDTMRMLGKLNEGGALKDFVVNLTALGRQIASGLIPILNKFFDIVASVAEEIRAMGSDTIGTIVQVVALSLAFNKLLSIMASLSQPFSILIGLITDVTAKSNTAGEAFVRMTGKMSGGLQRLSGGFSALGTSIATAMPLMDPEDNNLKELSDWMGKSSDKTDEASEAIIGLSDDFDSFGDRVKDSMKSAKQSVRGFTASLLGAVGGATDFQEVDFGLLFGGKQMVPTKTGQEAGEAYMASISAGMSSKMGAVSRAAGRVKSKLASALDGTVVQRWGRASVIAANVFAAGTTGAVSRVGDALSGLYSSMGNLRERLSVVSAPLLRLDSVLNQYATSLVSRVVPSTTIANSSILSLSTAMKVLAASTAIALGSFALIGVAAGALMAVGASGQDTESIISSLKDTAVSFFNAVKPLILQLGNTAIDVFNAIKKPISAFVAGLTDIGRALGLVSEGEGGGFMALVAGISRALVPAIDMVGNLALMLSGPLTRAVRVTMAAIVGLINTFNVAQILRLVGATVQWLAGAFMFLAKVTVGLMQVLWPLISGLAKIVAILGALLLALKVVTGVVALLSGIIAVLNLGLVGTLGLLTAITFPISGIALAIGALIAVIIVILEKLGVFDWLLNKIMQSINLFVDGILWMAKAVGGAIDAMIQKIIDLWNNTIGGQQIIPEFKIPGIPGIPFDGFKYGGAKIPKLDSGGGSGGDGGGDGGSNLGMGALTSGFGTMKGIGDAGKEAAMGGPPGKVEYNEGDTKNNFQQKIDADPEEKNKMKRVVKDAMEEANSFRRQQEGHHG